MNLLIICTFFLIAESFGLQLPREGRSPIKRPDSLVSSKKDDESPSRFSLDPARLPENTFVLYYSDRPSTVTLNCGVVAGSTDHRVQWTEFTTGQGRVLSDNNVILPGHPNQARYSIISDDVYGFNLQIFPVLVSDGGYYLCDDTTASPIDKKFHSASLTVGDFNYNCSSTIRPTGSTLDGSYQSNECQVNYQGGLIPEVQWYGPGDFIQASATTNSTIWIGMHFNATRDMNERSHILELYFTDYFLPVDSNSASNVPDYIGVYQGPQMFIFWGPGAMYASPIQDVYRVGDILTCHADAHPAPSYLWQNLRTTEVFNNQQFVVPASWLNSAQTMRCEARNIIDGQLYTLNYFLDVLVQAITEPTTPEPPSTTTDHPSVSDCTDLTGGWQSVSPMAASLCIKLDLDNNGALTGLFMNGTDSYWLDVVGRAEANKFDQVGFNGIWAFRQGVSSFVGECHRCFGEEVILVDVASRSKGSPCGTPGEVVYNDKFTFKRSSTVHCRNLPESM